MKARILLSLGFFALLTGNLVTIGAQPSLPQTRRLTVVCYWQNYAEIITSKIANRTASTGCEKYKDPSHCERTVSVMFRDAMDGKQDWERVGGDGLIYTIRCKHKCKTIPGPSASYQAETDGKLMWITFETPENKNFVEAFEVVDISPARSSSTGDQLAQPANTVQRAKSQISKTPAQILEEYQGTVPVIVAAS